MTKKKNRKWNNRLQLVVMAVVISLVIAGITKAMTIDGSVDELKALFGGNKEATLGTQVPDTEANFEGLVTMTGGLVVVDGINYTDINPDACAIQWVECTETASSGNATAGNPCEYTNATGAPQDVVDAGWITASGAASTTAAIDVGYSTTASETPAYNIFEALDLAIGFGPTHGVVDGLNYASSTASAFAPFTLSDGDSIFASQGYGDGGDPVNAGTSVTTGDMEEGIYSMWFKWCVPPTGYVDADVDS